PLPTSTPFPYTTLFRSPGGHRLADRLRVHLSSVANRGGVGAAAANVRVACDQERAQCAYEREDRVLLLLRDVRAERDGDRDDVRSEEHTSELQSRGHLV